MFLISENKNDDLTCEEVNVLNLTSNQLHIFCSLNKELEENQKQYCVDLNKFDSNSGKPTKIIKDIITKRGNLYFFRKNDNIIGFAITKPGMTNHVFVIDKLFIKNEFRNSGYGTELLTKLENHLKAKYKCKKLMTNCLGDNPANTFYSKNGFAPEAITYSKNI